MKSNISDVSNAILRTLGKLFAILLFLLFVFSGGVFGALKAIEDNYAELIIDEISKAEFVSCNNNKAINVNFIVENCSTITKTSFFENAIRDMYPDISLLKDNTSAILETFIQLDFPDLPEVSEIPESQELISLVESSQELDPLNFSNIGDYGRIALQFIEYFSQNGKILLDFLTSNTIANISGFFDEIQLSYLLAKQVIGYINILNTTKLPLRTVINLSVLGLAVGGLLFGILSWVLKKIYQKTYIWILGRRRKPREICTELEEIQDLSRRDQEFEKMVKRYKLR